MASLNVNMPDDLRSYVDERTRAGGFGTPTEYVRHLIRKDREEAAERVLANELARGLESPPARGTVKALVRHLHERIDRVERESKKTIRRGSKTTRPKGGR